MGFVGFEVSADFGQPGQTFPSQCLVGVDVDCTLVGVSRFLGTSQSLKRLRQVRERPGVGRLRGQGFSERADRQLELLSSHME